MGMRIVLVEATDATVANGRQAGRGDIPRTLIRRDPTPANVPDRSRLKLQFLSWQTPLPAGC